MCIGLGRAFSVVVNKSHNLFETNVKTPNRSGSLLLAIRRHAICQELPILDLRDWRPNNGNLMSLSTYTATI